MAPYGHASPVTYSTKAYPKPRKGSRFKWAHVPTWWQLKPADLLSRLGALWQHAKARRAALVKDQRQAALGQHHLRAAKQSCENGCHPAIPTLHMELEPSIGSVRTSAPHGCSQPLALQLWQRDCVTPVRKQGACLKGNRGSRLQEGPESVCTSGLKTRGVSRMMAWSCVMAMSCIMTPSFSSMLTSNWWLPSGSTPPYQYLGGLASIWYPM